MEARDDVDPADLLVRLLDLEDVSEVWIAIEQVCEEQDPAMLLAAAVAWCDDADPPVRSTGLDLLGRLALTVPAALDRLLDASAALLSHDDQTVRWTVAVNLGSGENSTDPRSIVLLLALLHDGDAEVRRRAVIGVNIPVEGESDDGPVVRALVAAMQDPDDEVRDWATFAIGSQRDVDTTEIRDILVERLADDDTDTSTAAEAAVGLARRGDPRALEPVLERLAGLTVGDLWVDAAMELGDPRLLPALLRLREHHWPDTEHDRRSLDAAIARCASPDPSSPNP